MTIDSILESALRLYTCVRDIDPDLVDPHSLGLETLKRREVLKELMLTAMETVSAINEKLEGPPPDNVYSFPSGKKMFQRSP